MFPIQTILYPTDFSDCAAAALPVAQSLARDLGARLIILHVAPPIEAFLLESPAVPVDPRFYRDALEAIRERLTGLDLKYPVETLLRQGEAAAEIVRVAQELDCDLIVLGTHGRTGLRRALMGSVAEAVLRRADCPVLTIKASIPVAAEPAAAEHAQKSVMVF